MFRVKADVAKTKPVIKTTDEKIIRDKKSKTIEVFERWEDIDYDPVGRK